MTDDAFLDILKTRRSVRRFTGKPVPRELLDRLVEAASWAPSAGNRQNREFTVVTSPSLKTQMSAATEEAWKRIFDDPETASVAEAMRDYAAHFDWFAAAPVVIAISAKKPEAFMDRMLGPLAADVAGAKTSAAMAAQNLMLAARAAGLGSCCLTAPLAAHDELKTLLGLGTRQALVCLVAVGYADEEPAPPPRKSPDTIARYIT